MFYNYFRDYDAATGRYVESDPIGLEGGWNTYTYVGSSPFRYADPKGQKWIIPGAATWVGGCAAYGFINAMYGYTPSRGGGADDKKRHCYATCLITKCSLWIPLAPIAIGIGKEVLDGLTTTQGFDWGDMRANMYGLRKAYLLTECETECNQCPLK
jgi:hypothetical protein